MIRNEVYHKHAYNRSNSEDRLNHASVDLLLAIQLQFRYDREITGLLREGVLIVHYVIISHAMDSSTGSSCPVHVKRGFMKMKVGPIIMRLTKPLRRKKMKKVQY